MNSVKLQDTKYTEICFCTLITNLSERKVKKTITFTTASKRIKYLGINLAKEVQNLYSENYKTLLKEIKNDLNK